MVQKSKRIFTGIILLAGLISLLFTGCPHGPQKGPFSIKAGTITPKIQGFEILIHPTKNVEPGTQVSLSVGGGGTYTYKWSFDPPNTVESLILATAPDAWYFDMPNANVTVNLEILETTVNLAKNRGKFALASDGANAANAFDDKNYTGTGSTAGSEAKTYWQAANSANAHWIGLDLGNILEVGYIRIFWYPGSNSAWEGMTAFEIQVGEIDGNGYAKVPATYKAGNYSDDGWIVDATYRYEGRSSAGTTGPTSGTDGFSTDTLDSASRWNVVVQLDSAPMTRWIRVKMIQPLNVWTDGKTNYAWTQAPRISGFEVYRDLPDFN